MGNMLKNMWVICFMLWRLYTAREWNCAFIVIPA